MCLIPYNEFTTLSICRECTSKDYIHCWLSKTLHQAFLEILRLGEGLSILQIHSLWRCLVQSQFDKCYLLGKRKKIWRNYSICCFCAYQTAVRLTMLRGIRLGCCWWWWCCFYDYLIFWLCSVFTPYCSEIVLYSMDELLKKNEDGISILFYLQKIFPGSFTSQLKFIRLALVLLYLCRLFSGWKSSLNTFICDS
jgi:hypothetical protein